MHARVIQFGYFQKWEHLNPSISLTSDIILLQLADIVVHISHHILSDSIVYMSSTYISGISKAHFFCSKIDMESKRNSSNQKNYQQQRKEEEELEQQGDQEEEENNEILKRRISSHPLYGLLVETHLECLKVGDISNLDSVLKIDHQMQAMKKQNLGMFSQTELDLFMEAYCLALGQLKEAMEEPQQKSMAFINNMHSQLRELTMATVPPPAEPAAADATSSSECKFRRNPTI